MNSRWDDADPEAVEEAFQRVAQAEGNLRAALEVLDGDGGETREDLAEALALVANATVALRGGRKLAGRGTTEAES